MALSKDGRVYEWTENFLPELQTGFPEKAGITQIAAGLGHSMALTSCGKVYCWGANEDGQLGMGNFTEQLKPRKVIPAPGVEIDKKIISIACGRSSSFAVSEDGDVRYCSYGLLNQSQICLLNVHDIVFLGLGMG